MREANESRLTAQGPHYPARGAPCTTRAAGMISGRPTPDSLTFARTD